MEHFAVLLERLLFSERAPRFGKRDAARGERRQVSQDEDKVAFLLISFGDALVGQAFLSPPGRRCAPWPAVAHGNS